MIDIFTLLVLLNDGHGIDEIHVRRCIIDGNKVTDDMLRYTVHDDKVTVDTVSAEDVFYSNLRWLTGPKSY